MKRIFCLILAALLTLPMIACAEGEETETTVSTNAPAQTDADPATLLEVPEQDYNYELTFLTYGASGNEWSAVDFIAEKMTGDPLNDAIYDRNAIMKEKYGVTILEIQSVDIREDVRKANNAGTTEFQAVISQTDAAANMSSSDGSLLNLSEFPHLDFAKSWWDQSATAAYSIDDRVYYTTGDLLTIDNDATFIMMFNKSMIADKQMDSPYDLVANRTWTLEKLSAMMKEVANDGSGNGSMSHEEDGDIFGLSGGTEMIYSVFYSAGLQLAKKDDTDIPVPGLDLSRADEVLTWAHDNIANKNVSFVFHYVSSDYTDAQKLFTSGRALFYGECLQCVTRLRNADNTVTFGVVPYPMLNEEQTQYYGYINNVAQVVCVPKTMDKETETLGAILEAMACYSQIHLTPAYYERSLLSKGLKDEESAPMLDIILQNRIFDLGYIFHWANYDSAIVNAVQSGKKISSLNSSYASRFQKAIEQTIKAYEKDT